MPLEEKPPSPSPVYYVIYTQERPEPPYYYYQCSRIVACYACDMSDVGRLWDEVAAPLANADMQVQATIFRREPDNPFKHVAKPVGWLPGDAE